jgi:hypothetical protein
MSPASPHTRNTGGGRIFCPSHARIRRIFRCCALGVERNGYRLGTGQSGTIGIWQGNHMSGKEGSPSPRSSGQTTTGGVTWPGRRDRCGPRSATTLDGCSHAGLHVLVPTCTDAAIAGHVVSSLTVASLPPAPVVARSARTHGARNCCRTFWTSDIVTWYSRFRGNCG